MDDLDSSAGNRLSARVENASAEGRRSVLRVRGRCREERTDHQRQEPHAKLLVHCCLSLVDVVEVPDTKAATLALGGAVAVVSLISWPPPGTTRMHPIRSRILNPSL